MKKERGGGRGTATKKMFEFGKLLCITVDFVLFLGHNELIAIIKNIDINSLKIEAEKEIKKPGIQQI